MLPARYPTVPLNKAILRISLTAQHTQADGAKFLQALKESHERLLTVLNSIDVLIYAADLDTHEIVFMNHRMETLIEPAPPVRLGNS